jgi:hypothetical protein
MAARMTEILLMPLRLATQLIIVETTLLEEMTSMFFPMQENCSQVMEECGIWNYGEIPIDMSL